MQPCTETPHTASHAMLRVLASSGIDRVFVVPGESYLGILDALSDFPDIDVVTCRHESGASFMAGVDGRLTGRPGVAMVSRGPGAANAAIGLHAAQQDAVPLILVIGQVPKRHLRMGAFQEIDYQQMYGSIAKWVYEVTSPEDLELAAFKAVRIAMSDTPGPVVLAIPEDVQQQRVDTHHWRAAPAIPAPTDQATVARIEKHLASAHRPLIIAGSMLARPGGREALLRLAEHRRIPVVVSFRNHDLFPNDHPLFAGNLDLANPAGQIAAFDSSDLILALGTRLGDITTQGYRFPRLPRPSQFLVHCYPDTRVINQHFAADIGVAGDAAGLAQALSVSGETPASEERAAWVKMLKDNQAHYSAWPVPAAADDGVPFAQVVQTLARHKSDDMMICLDAGTFAAPVYRHFGFTPPQRLIASFSGAMGYGTPAAVAAQLRHPEKKVICLVGDGGFMMTGNEMIAAAERKLPILFILSNNHCYGSIRLHQARTYPGRYAGTGLTNPDFVSIARAFGMTTEHVADVGQIDSAIQRGLQSKTPYLIEVETSLSSILPDQGVPDHDHQDTLPSRTAQA